MGLSGDSTGLQWTKLQSMGLSRDHWRSFGSHWWSSELSESQWVSLELNEDQYSSRGFSVGVNEYH